MHPAPMPLNKHGRPFAPVTTLQQYMLTSDIGEDVVATSDFGNQEQTTSTLHLTPSVVRATTR